MQRTLEVTVDESTWASSPFSFPSSFHTGPSQWDLNVPLFLLVIGVLTTPSHASGISFSEFWAWVRYLHAVSDDRDFRVTRAFAELDAHQKTILSDDFGMGAPMLWLLERLQLGPFAEGRYFIDRLAASVGASAAQSSKRGPGKSPDFVARDMSGVWHIIECKGTQSSLHYRNQQLGGAVVQKQTITFPPGHAGQQLGCGLYIGVEDGAYSNLRIIDPPAKELFEVQESHIAYAEDAINRSVGSRALRLAGFHATSSALSAPSGTSPNSPRPTVGYAEQLRREIVSQKIAQAKDELANRDQYEIFQVSDEHYRGRTVDISLPTLVGIGGPPIQGVRLRYGVNVKFLDELAELRFLDEVHTRDRTDWHEMIGRTFTDSVDTEAKVQMGTIFVGEIRLRRQ